MRFAILVALVGLAAAAVLEHPLIWRKSRKVGSWRFDIFLIITKKLALFIFSSKWSRKESTLLTSNTVTPFEHRISHLWDSRWVTIIFRSSYIHLQANLGLGAGLVNSLRNTLSRVKLNRILPLRYLKYSEEKHTESFITNCMRILYST